MSFAARRLEGASDTFFCLRPGEPDLVDWLELVSVQRVDEDPSVQTWIRLVPEPEPLPRLPSGPTIARRLWRGRLVEAGVVVAPR